MSFKKILPVKVFQKTYKSLLLLLPLLAITGIVFCYFYTDSLDSEDLPDISLHNSDISYQIFDQPISFNTLIQPISITQVCINALFTRAPPQSILF